MLQSRLEKAPDTYEKKCICCSSNDIKYLNCTNANGHEVYKCKRCDGIFSCGKKRKK